MDWIDLVQDLEWIDLVQDWDMWLDLVNAEMNHWIP
jgi:hypothetical protein